MYDLAYHLNADPFRLSPDHRFCYRHKSYARSKAYLDYALSRGEGFVMITGAPGSGKTTLLNDVLTKADKSNRAMARIVTTQLDAHDLLRMVAFSFNLNTQRIDKASILNELERFLVRQYQQHHHSLLVIDEAQDLDTSALEEIRLLTNLQIDGHALLQVFLVGQNNLLETIQDPAMEQLHQRLIASSHLEPMSADETETYVIHRLRKAGWKNDPLISRGALRRIHIFSCGVPRIVNQLCSRFLLYGSVEDKHKLDSHDAEAVISELCHEHLAPISSNQNPGKLYSENPQSDEMAEILQYDRIFLDSTAFTTKQTYKNVSGNTTPPTNVHHLPHHKSETEKELIETRHTANVKQTTKPENKSDKQPRAPFRSTPVKKDNTGIAKHITFEIENKQAKQQSINRRREKLEDNRLSYTLVGFLLAVLFSVLILFYPEPAGNQPTLLTAKPVSEMTANNLSGPDTKNKEVTLTAIQDNIEKTLANHAVEYSKTKQGLMKIKLNINDQFSWGSAIMSNNLQSKLGGLASAMLNQPQAIIHIIGHSDPSGSKERNVLLSKLRAKVVANFLVLRGLPQHRLSTDGRGSNEIIDTTNPQANRRVELYIEALTPNNKT